MSQFRIRKIDTGLPDEWVPRTNDDGFQFGDDIVAEDPNDLAGAIYDTQELLLKASVYAPSVLINANSGVLERIKLIEDTVGSTTLQSAYESGNVINPAPGSPLILGPGGTIEIDSGGNLSFNPSTMRIRGGQSQFLNFSVNNINTSTNNLTIQTSGANRNLALIAGNELSLRDRFLLAPVTLSETGVTTLQTSSKSIVGAINEVRNAATSAGLQQIYNQSFPARIETSVANGRLIVENKTGNALTPALEIIGNMIGSGEVKSGSLVVGAGAGSLTVNSSGALSTVGNITSSSEVRTPSVRSTTSALVLADVFGSASLTSVVDPSLLTQKKTIFGAINELYTTTIANSSSLAAYASQHNSTTGFHEIIITRASTGQNSTDRFVVRNDIGTDVTRINALGEVRASNFLLPTFNLLTETQANNTHRNGDGLDHSAVFEHINDPNPHNTVKSINTEGRPLLSGAIVLREGAGVNISQQGQEITLSAPLGGSISGVYESEAAEAQGAGETVDIPLVSGVDLYFKNEIGESTVAFFQEFTKFFKSIELSSFSKIEAEGVLDMKGGAGVEVSSTAGDIDINPAGVFNVKGLTIVSTSAPVLPGYYSDNLVQTVLNEIEGNYTPFRNNTNEVIKAGTPITIDSDKVGFDPSSAWAPLANAQIIGDEIWLSSCFGIATQDINIGQDGFAKIKGVVKANIGRVNSADEGEFQINDVLYIAPAGYAEVEFTNAPANGNSIVLDGVTFTVGPGGPAVRQFPTGANAGVALDNFIRLVNNKDAKRDDYVGKTFRAIADGINAKADIFLSDNLVAGDTFTINAANSGGVSATFTAVAAGNKTTVLQFEVATSANGTALNLFEAIKSTTRRLPGQVAGHLCVPQLVGTTIRLTAKEKGTAGNLISLSANNARIQRPANLSGGKLWARVYFFSRISTGKTVTASGANIRVSNFIAEESESFYMPARLLFAEDRNPDFDAKIIKVGKVVDIQGEFPNATTSILVEIEDADVY